MTSSRQGRHIAGIVGANIRRARDARRLTQRELALLMGGKVDGQRVSDWERGAYKPSDGSLARLSEVLGHELAWFYTVHDDEPVAA